MKIRLNTLAKMITNERKDHGIDTVMAVETLNKGLNNLIIPMKLSEGYEYEVDRYNIFDELPLEPGMEYADGEMISYRVEIYVAVALLEGEDPLVRASLSSQLMAAYADIIKRKASEEIKRFRGPSLKEYEVVKAHGFTSNRMFRGETIEEDPDGGLTRADTDDGLTKTDHYISWLRRFPRHEVKGQKYWEDRGVDFSKPIHLHLGFVHMKIHPSSGNPFDMANFEKSFIDLLFDERKGVIKVDDSIITKVTKCTVAYCDSYYTGRIYYHISNDKGGRK